MEVVQKTILEYVKDKKGRLGLIVASVGDNDSVFFGYSKYAKAHEIAPFNKELAFEIALGRMAKPIFLEDIPPSMRTQVFKFLIRCHKYFKRLPINVMNTNIDSLLLLHGPL